MICMETSIAIFLILNAEGVLTIFLGKGIDLSRLS